MRRLIPLIILTAATLSGCGVNPVTGERELQFVSESQEIAIGKQQYSPSRQMQGGDYVVDQQLTEYVSSVGERLAIHSDRPLPYEFVVLNNSVPNAWALPGGKIAFNRGLLTELGSEAELAAVMGHEIVHSAARHGAKSMERGILMQGALLALAVSVNDNRYSNLIVGGAQVGAQLVTLKHGRDAERESDLYGMEYMKKAGYDPAAAVDLQKTFVRLSQQRQKGNSNWLDGLLSSHPASEERVRNNEATAARIGTGGDYGRERYQAAIARLLETKPAYEAYDEALKAMEAGDTVRARQLAEEALRIEPAEAKFHALIGDIDANNNRYASARSRYDRAIALNPQYFQFYLGRGLLSQTEGRLREAESDLTRSVNLLPTAPAYFSLGQMAANAGRTDQAIEYYKVAAGSSAPVGKRAAASMMRLDLPRNPGNYIQSAVRVSNEGEVLALLGNRSPSAVRNVTVEVVVLDATGQRIVDRKQLRARQVLGAGQQTSLRTGIGPVTDQSQLNRVRVQVTGAQLAE